MHNSTNPVDFRQELYSRYVSRFKGPGSEVSDARWYRWSEYKLLPLLREVSRDGAILDIGCGAGQMLHFLKDHGFANVSGVDISAEQVALAAARGLQARVADVFEYLRGSREEFEAIVALDIVEHFGKSEQIPLFEAIFSALRPGGKLILQTPNGDGLFSAQVIYGDLTHLTIFNEGSLSQLLQLVGFEALSFYETGPAPKDLKGRVRGLLWQAIRLMSNGARVIESGETQRLWTKNLICCCRRPISGDVHP
jgi:cyclopropane fatty-acyl-phospholipid synthase-like methyltransferase